MIVKSTILILIKLFFMVSVSYSALTNTDDTVRNVLKKLNEEFAKKEAIEHSEGYCVTIETQPILKAKIVSYGSRRVDKQLSGMPDDLEDYMRKCPFCAYPKKTPDDPRILKVFKGHSYVLMSLSNQMLVISKQHYSHWFAIPLEDQIELLHNILDIRKSHLSQVKKAIEFHCGSAAGQTVFHFHGRTGVYAH